MTGNTPESGETDARATGSADPSGAEDESKEIRAEDEAERINDDEGTDTDEGSGDGYTGDDGTGQFYDALETLGRPVVTATRYAQLRDQSQADAAAELDSLEGREPSSDSIPRRTRWCGIRPIGRG